MSSYNFILPKNLLTLAILFMYFLFVNLLVNKYRVIRKIIYICLNILIAIVYYAFDILHKNSRMYATKQTLTRFISFKYRKTLTGNTCKSGHASNTLQQVIYLIYT